jgi:hypothetical protein
MTEFHSVMTIQSFWNGEPKAAVTRAVVLNARDTQQAYDLMYVTTMEAWRVENSRTSMGTPAVMHWSCSPTAAEPADSRYGNEDGTSVEADALAAWLIKKGFAEERRGYGHIDGETLAEALLARFSLTTRD